MTHFGVETESEACEVLFALRDFLTAPLVLEHIEEVGVWTICEKQADGKLRFLYVEEIKAALGL